MSSFVSRQGALEDTARSLEIPPLTCNARWRARNSWVDTRLWRPRPRWSWDRRVTLLPRPSVSSSAGPASTLEICENASTTRRGLSPTRWWLLRWESSAAQQRVGHSLRPGQIDRRRPLPLLVADGRSGCGQALRLIRRQAALRLWPASAGGPTSRES